MRIKLNSKKIISILCALAVLVTALPLNALLMPTKAAATGNLIDFEGQDATDIVAGNDAFTIGGQDRPDKKYFYSKNKTKDELVLTFDDIALEAGKKYTLDMDIYTLRTSEDAENRLLGLKVYGEETSLNATVSNLDIIEEKWANYHVEFEAKEAANKFDFSIFTIGKVVIDDLAIIDENGKKIVLDYAAACEASELKDHFAAATLVEIVNEEPDVIQGYIKADIAEQSFSAANEYINIPFDTVLEEGKYTLNIDLKFASISSDRVTMCLAVFGNQASGEEYKWYLDGNKVEMNKYATYSRDYNLSEKNTFFRLHVYQGTTVSIDNISLVNAAGEEVVKFDFDTAVQFDGSQNFVQKGIPKTKAQSARLYKSLRNSVNNNAPAHKFLFDAGESFRTSYDGGRETTATIKFDYYLKSGSVKVYGANNTNEKGYLEEGVHSFELSVSSHSFWFSERISAEAELYIWNVELTQGGSALEFASYTARTTCDYEKITYGAIPFPNDESSSEDNYVISIDNSKGTNFGQLYLHEVGMDYSKTYPVGDYTFKFDFYALEIGSNKNIVAHLTAPNWSGDAYPYSSGQKWLEIQEKVGEWQTISFDVTTIKDGQFPWFYIGAGIKGYFDNYQIIDKKTGETVLNFTPTAADLGKTSKEICKVEKIAGKTEEKPAAENAVLLVDTTSVDDNGTANKNFWFNELGMASYYNKLVSGEQYTITFDVYPEKMPNSNNLFHYRTSSGSASSNAGWWGKDLEVGKWQTTSNTFTVQDGAKTGNHILYVYGGFKGYIDNLKLVDKNGNTVEGTFTGIDGLTVPDKHKDYLKIEIQKSDNKPAVKETVMLVDTTSVDDNGSANKNFWFNELGMASYYNKLVSGKKYTITFDVYPEKMPNSNNLFHYRTSNGSASSDAGWWGKDLEVGKWQTTSNTFTVTDASKSGNHILFVYGGFKGYIDNLKLVDENGNTVEGTFTDFSDITVPDKHKDYLTITEITIGGDEPAVKETVLLVDTTSVADNGNDNKNFWFNELGMASYYNKLVSGEQYTITFDVYPEKMPNSNNLFHYRTSSGSASSNAGWWGKDLEVGKWQTTSNTFTVQDGAKTGNHVLYVYGGFKGYIDNLKLVDKNGNTVEGTFTDFSDLTVPDKHKDYLTITEITIGGDEPEEPEHSNDFAIELDNSKGTNYGQFYLHELGMAYDTIYPVGNYTVKFDIYLLEMASNDDIVACLSASGWSGSAFPGSEGQVWLDIADKVGEWQTISFNVTTVKEGQFPNFHLGAGIKAYFDNYQIIDNKTGNTVLDFTPAEADLGKTSKGISKVVELPVDVADRDGGSTPEEPEEPVITSGMNIAFLKGVAGKNGASIKLGGAKSPLTLKSNTPYKLSFMYYQANPTPAGTLDLFGIAVDESVVGAANDVTWFKKNNEEGWATGYVYFTTGNVSSTAEDWLEIVLNSNAWVYFDNFKISEQKVDNNKAVEVVTFDAKDDSIYPELKVEDCVFAQSDERGGTFKAVNATEYTNETKNSNRQYAFQGIKMKSYTTYRVSIDYYVDAPINDYAAAFGYNPANLGAGSSTASWPCFINNIAATGKHTASFTVTTGEVVPNANYINLVFYDVADSSEPRVMYFDNLTFTELYRVETSANDTTLGTVSKTKTIEGGKDTKVVANAFAGATFEGWYEYGDLVSTDKIYHIKNIDDNHKLVARFSGETEPAKTIVQSFEDYDLGDIGMEYYEIVNDSKNVLDGKQSLHLKPDTVTNNIEASIFFPVVSNVKYQLKDDYSYDFYVWVKPAKKPESVAYYAIVNSISRDLSDMVYSGELSGTSMSLNIKPQAASALEEKDGWYKYQLGTITKKNASMDGYAFQICKFHDKRMEGASIDDLYIDRIEVVERTPDFENLKYTEKFFNDITNSNFEEKVTAENWAPLTDGVTVEKVTDKEYDWQGNYNLKFDAAKSNGNEYVRIIPISKTNKNYTFAAWSKLSKDSDITVGLYKNGQYVKFKNIVNGENGTLPLVDDGKWNRVSFTFNTGDSNEAYLVIKGTKGTLYLDMVELFIAERGYLNDPNTYGDTKVDFDFYDPIAFPDEVIVDKTVIETIVEEDEEEQIEEIEEETEEKKPSKKKKYKVVVKKPGGISSWVWVGVGAGVLVLAAGAVLFIIFLKKRKNKEKEAK